jgi:hypothetical protein
MEEVEDTKSRIADISIEISQLSEAINERKDRIDF